MNNKSYIDDYVDRLRTLLDSQGYSAPNSNLIKNGKKMLQALIDHRVLLVPVVSNTSLGHTELSDGSFFNLTGPFYITVPKVKSNVRITLHGTKYYVEPIDGSGLYSRLEELLNLGIAKVVGTHTIRQKTSSTHEVCTTCYIIGLKRDFTYEN
jgi:hypothetical protein